MTMLPLQNFSPTVHPGTGIDVQFFSRQRKAYFHFAVKQKQKISDFGSTGKFSFASETRRDGLWKHTCFEIFLCTGMKEYYEINLSPLGFWNAYQFTDLREGMCPTQTVVGADLSSVTFEFQAGHCEVVIDFSKVHLSLDFQVGMTAVIVAEGATSYWAMAHLQDKPNFHDRLAWKGTLHV